MASYSFCGFTKSSQLETRYRENTDNQLQLTPLCCSPWTLQGFQKPAEFPETSRASRNLQRFQNPAGLQETCKTIRNLQEPTESDELCSLFASTKTFNKWNYGLNSANSPTVFQQDPDTQKNNNTVQFTSSEGPHWEGDYGNHHICINNNLCYECGGSCSSASETNPPPEATFTFGSQK